MKIRHNPWTFQPTLSKVQLFMISSPVTDRQTLTRQVDCESGSCPSPTLLMTTDFHFTSVSIDMESQTSTWQCFDKKIPIYDCRWF